MAPGVQLGPYKLLRVLGEGGFASVYLAEQLEPVKRRVALKILKPGMDSRQVLARFEAERQALALLDHPHIAQIYDAGSTKQGHPYFVMEHVKGIPITDHCDRHKLSIEERLRLFLLVCEAIQHAHQKGIIHRDLKPSNVIIQMEGDRAIPKVIDFGIAKATSQPLTERTLFTEQGQLIGTPEYMSPEQAEMTNQEIDTRSDIYSLGVLLYELLTGMLPFDHQTLREAALDQILRIIREQDPPRPSAKLSSLGEEAETVAGQRRTELRTLIKRLNNELEWIPLKAMRKEPAQRYRTAAELADDIMHYLCSEPLVAGPESISYRTKKFVRRNRILVTSVVTVLMVLVLATVVSTRMYFRAEGQREIATDALEKENAALVKAEQAHKAAEDERDRAQEETEARRQAHYFTHISAAQNAIRSKDCATALEHLLLCPKDLRHWEWYHLWLLSDQSISTLRPHHDLPVWSIAMSPDGRRLASTSGFGPVKILDTATGNLHMTLPADPNLGIGDLTYSCCGKYVAAYGFTEVVVQPAGTSSGYRTESPRVVVWDAITGAVVSTMGPIRAGGPASSLAVAFSPDSTRIAVMPKWSSIEIRDIASATVMMTLAIDDIKREDRADPRATDDGERRMTSMAFSSDGERIAAVSEHGVAFVWDANNGERISRTEFHESSLRNRKSSASSLGYLRSIWRALPAIATGISPDCRQVVSGNNEGILRIWDITTGQEIRSIRGHEGEIFSVAFAPDANTVVSAGEDQVIKMWNATSGALIKEFLGHTSIVTSVQFSNDGKYLASAGRDNAIRLWDPTNERRQLTLRINAGPVTWVGFSVDGNMVYSDSLGGALKLWDAESGIETAAFDPISPPPGIVSLSPDRTQIASGGRHEYLTLSDLRTGVKFLSVRLREDEIQLNQEERYKIQSLKTSSARKQRQQELMDRLRMRSRLPRPGIVLPGRRSSNSDSPPSTLRSSSKSSSSVPISGKTDPTWVKGITALTFSPDGMKIVCGTTRGTVQVYDILEKKVVAALSAHSGFVSSVTLSPNAKQIVSAGEDGAIKLWDLSSSEVKALTGHGGKIWSVAFNHNGTRIVSASMDRTIKIWDVDSDVELKTLYGHQGQVFQAYFSPDGDRIVSGCEDGTVRLWDVGSGAEIMTFHELEKPVYWVAFSPGGKRIAAACADETVRVWNAASSEEVASRMPKTASSSAGRLVGQWKMDETEGRIVSDFSGEGLDGHLVGDASWQSGYSGSAIKFDGDGDFVEFANYPVFSRRGAITVAVWVRVTLSDKSTKSLLTILAKGSTAWRLQWDREANNIALHINANSSIDPPPSRESWDSWKSGWFTDQNAGINDNRWHHIAGVYDGLRVYVYIDGKLHGVRPVLIGEERSVNSEPFCIGACSDNRETDWEGLIDDVRIYDYALSEQDVRSLYEDDESDDTR